MFLEVLFDYDTSLLLEPHTVRNYPHARTVKSELKLTPSAHTVCKSLLSFCNAVSRKVQQFSFPVMKTYNFLYDWLY